MKQKNILQALVATFILAIGFAFYAQAQQDCGAIDCPGRCGRFIDQNGDGFCDHGRISAPAKPEVEKTTEAPVISETPKSPAKVETPAQKEEKKSTTPIAPATSQAAEQEQATEDVMEIPTDDNTEEDAPAEPVKTKSPYCLILISSLTLGLYVVSCILVKANVWKKATHRKVWNVLLLITALVSCLLGFFLVIQINYNLKMDWLWTVKVYHVQFGIAMTIIAVIHILWHINYWKSIVKKRE